MSNLNTQTSISDQPVTAPAIFNVAWDDPRDAKLTWMFNDKYRVPVPLLIHKVLEAFLVGGGVAFDQWGLPFTISLARINTFQYIGMVPTAAPPEVVIKAMGLLNRAAPGAFKLMMGKMTDGMSKKQLDVLNPIIERFETYWNGEILPEIKEHLAYFDSIDIRGMSLDQLHTLMLEALKRVDRMGALHGFVLLPSLFAISQFEELYRELFAEATTLDALRLTQGFENKIMEGDRALWRLSRIALSTPEVASIISGKPTGEVMSALEKSAACQPFLTSLRDWLAQYGQRLNHAFALDEPDWIEDPTPAIEYLQAYLEQSEPRPEMDPAKLITEREQAVAEARARLSGYPQPVTSRFETLLKAAQLATVALEDHNYWIDQRLFYRIRRVIMEYGQHLAQIRSIDSASDVFFLSPDELETGRDASLKNLVNERKTEIERFGQVTPPQMLGTPPAFDMGDGGPLVRALFKGEMNPANTNKPEAHAVKGLAGSAGVARGTARLIDSLAEADKLQSGDVLVAKSTLPPWTPLFATAVAVVTDTGGVLCHSAVVAREYRIPAVVGTGNATSTFNDGELLEVDGNAGTVRVVTEENTHEPSVAG